MAPHLDAVLERGNSRNFEIVTSHKDSEHSKETPTNNSQSDYSRDDKNNDDDNDFIVVDWDGIQDPANPTNWSPLHRWATVIMISAITFNQAMSSTMLVPGVPQIMHDFSPPTQQQQHNNNNDTILSKLLVSIYAIGLAVGPLILSPLSELYGRTPLMHLTNATFLIAALLSAVSTDIAMLLVFRLFMGMSTISLGGAYVADLMGHESRGRAMNVWSVGPVLAPIAGPIIGGYMSLKTSWRWTFGVVGITGAFWTIVCVIFLRETYAPRLLELKTQRLRAAASGSSNSSRRFRSVYDDGHSPSQRLHLSLTRPWRMSICCPSIAMVSLFGALAYSYMYFSFATFTDVFESTYDFNAGEAGLAYLGLGLGSLVGQCAIDISGSWQAKRRRERGSDGGDGGDTQMVQAEEHLPPLIFAGVLLCSGQLCYGWALEFDLHWLVPLVGTFLGGMGIMFVFQAVQTYLVEAYTIYAASALALSVAIRCLFGLTVPLAAPALYGHLGPGWGNTLLAFIALTLVPTALCLCKYGGRVRSSEKGVRV